MLTLPMLSDPRIAQYFYTQLVEVLEGCDWPLIVFGTCTKLRAVSETIRETSLHEVIIEVSVESTFTLLQHNFYIFYHIVLKRTYH